MRDAKIVHYLLLGLLSLIQTAVALADSKDAFDPKPLVRQVDANVNSVRALESSARNAGSPDVLRCVTDKIRDARVLREEFARMAANMSKSSVQVAQMGRAPLDVPAQGVPEIAVMVAGVKSVSDSAALVVAARRCFAVSEDTEIRWLPAVESAPVSSISAIGSLR